MSTRLLRSLPAILLAALLPLAVLSVGGRAVLGGDGATGRAAAIDRELRQGPAPDVVVLGSSLARTNVDVTELARGLRIPPRQIAMITLPNATAAHWYAILEHRVFGAGYRPRLVLVVGALTTMVTPDVLMDANGERLVNLLSDHEPVIAAKVFRDTDPREFGWLRWRGRAGEVRDLLLERFRDRVLAALFSRRGLPGEGAKLAARANEQVFADERMAYELHRAGSTGLFVGEVEQLDVRGVDVARDSLLPDLVDLAEANGATIVFVRTPFPPSNADNDLVPADAEAAAEDVVRARGGVYLDLRGLSLSESHFRDMRHMSTDGARVFTRAITTTLREAGGVGAAGAVAAAPRTQRSRRGVQDGALPVDGPPRVDGCAQVLRVPALVGLDDEALAVLPRWARRPVRVTVDGVERRWVGLVGCEAGYGIGADGMLRVVAQPGAVVAVTRALDDETPDDAALWVPPGGTVTFAFPEPWAHDARALRVMLLGHALSGAVEDVTVTVFGQRGRLTAAGALVWGDLLPARAPTDRPWTVEVSVAPGGPWLRVDNLAVGVAPFTTHVVGRSESLYGASARVVGGKADDTALDVSFSGPPPSLDRVGPPTRGPRGTGAFDVPRLRALADATDPNAPRPDKCSPLRVLEDGVPLAAPHATCQDVAALRGGRSCHVAGALYFAPSDGSNALDNGRTYTLALDPDRLCERLNQVEDTTPLRDSLWVYPGDRAEVRVAEGQLRLFRRGADALELAVDPVLGGASPRLRVEVIADGEVVHVEELVASGARREHRLRRLDRPVPADARDVRLVMSSEAGGGYWRVVLASLSEASPFAPRRPAEVDAGLDARAVDPADEAVRFAPGEADFGVATPQLFGAARAPTDGVAPTRASRTGTPAALPRPKDLRFAEDDVLEARVFPLWPISDAVLARRGLGWVSPLRVSVSGTPLAPATSRAGFRGDGCRAGCSMHAAESVLVRGLSVPSAEALSLSLSADLPLDGPQGQRVYWVYPGTTVSLAWTVPATSPSASVEVRLMSMRLDRATYVPATVTVGGVSAPLSAEGVDGAVAHVALGRTAQREVRVDVAVPASGAYAVLRGVDLLDGDVRTVLLSDPTSLVGTVED